jgi:hemoglobin
MTPPPSLYSWIGGAAAIDRLTTLFYARVPADPILATVFARMSADHPRHVAEFLAEVFGGPKAYSSVRGGHASMIRHHLAKNLSQEQRRRWVALFLECADSLGVPDDPEFRSALVSYLEWGTRLAVINSQPGVAVVEDAPMPTWGWGEVGGPYLPGGASDSSASTDIKKESAPDD